MDTLALEPGDAHVVYLRLNNAGTNNAIDQDFCAQISLIVDEIESNKDIKVLIIKGLPDVFCSGATHAFLHDLVRHYKNNIEHPYANHFKQFLNIPIPVIAAMEGSATGGGLLLGLYADVLIAAEESRYGMSFMNMGFTPGMGATFMSVEAFGYYTGFEMMATGNYLKGRDLRGKCCFNYILPREHVMGKATELAAAIAEKPRHSLELLKKCMSIERRKMLESSRTLEAFMHYISFGQTLIEQKIQTHFEN